LRILRDPEYAIGFCEVSYHPHGRALFGAERLEHSRHAENMVLRRKYDLCHLHPEDGTEMSERIHRLTRNFKGGHFRKIGENFFRTDAWCNFAKLSRRFGKILIVQVSAKGDAKQTIPVIVSEVIIHHIPPTFHGERNSLHIGMRIQRKWAPRGAHFYQDSLQLR
jgi:hypothetical protein